MPTRTSRDLQEALAQALADPGPSSNEPLIVRARDHFRRALLGLQNVGEPGLLALHAVSLSHYTVGGRANDDIPHLVQVEHFRLDASVDALRSLGFALLQVPSIAGNLLDCAKDPAVVARWTACARSLPEPLLRSLTFWNPSNQRLGACGHELVFLARPGVGLVLDGRARLETEFLALVQLAQCPYVVVLTADRSSVWRSCLVDCEHRRFTFPERSHQKHRRVDLKVASLGPTGVGFKDAKGASLDVAYEDFDWEPMSPFEMARTEG